MVFTVFRVSRLNTEHAAIQLKAWPFKNGPYFSPWGNWYGCIYM